MNTCKTCKHWKRWSRENLPVPERYPDPLPGECGLIGSLKNDDDIYYWGRCDGDDDLAVTGPNFGCIHHSEKGNQ